MRHEQGYSLFEVLVAFTIMAGVLAVILPGQSALLARTVTEEERLLARDYAASRLAELGITVPLAEGKFREAYRAWEVEMRMEEVGSGEPLAGMFRIEIDIWSADGRLLSSVETLRRPR